MYEKSEGLNVEAHSRTPMKRSRDDEASDDVNEPSTPSPLLIRVITAQEKIAKLTEIERAWCQWLSTQLPISEEPVPVAGIMVYDGMENHNERMSSFCVNHFKHWIAHGLCAPNLALDIPLVVARIFRVF